ncbi:MAG: PQQ-dependent sugar dehydrogenase [Planctomycetota bacterium]
MPTLHHHRLALSLLVLLLTPVLASAQLVRSELVASGLNQPLNTAFIPGDPDRLFIVEQTGTVRILDLTTDTLLPGAFINLSGLIQVGGERGLLGLAFHPDYLTNGLFYVNYTDTSGNTVVAQCSVNGDPATSNTANAGIDFILTSFVQDFANHNGGHIAFGPDGMLYVASGDGGSFNDPFERAQDPTSLLGKMLRLEVEDTAGGFIPDDNPFVTDPGTRDEIWALGVRNPWRFSFDRVTGDMWMGDVGQDAREEINFQAGLTMDNIDDVGGLNYGWDCREGFIASPFADKDCSLGPNYEDPIYDLNHSTDGVCSITGGVVYRGSAIPALQGHYLFADYCADFIRTITFDGVTATDGFDLTGQLSSGGSTISLVVAFGEDHSGEVYVVSLNGTVHRIIPDDGNCGCPCALVGPQGELLADDFESDMGWTTASAASSGDWQRAVPINDLGWEYDPVSDFDGSSSCFVTQNTAGNSDVDSGTVTLTSPVFDGSAGELTICFAYYLNMTNPGANDGLFVEVSNGGPWIPIAGFQSSNGLLWTAEVIDQAALDSAGVTPTSTMQVRFIAADVDGGNIVEAAIDDVSILTGNPFEDCNGNGIDDAQDILMGTSFDCNGNSIPDECDIASMFSEDCAGGPVGVPAAGDAFFMTSCIGCHGPMGTGGTGPNIRNIDRVTIEQRLTLAIPHPGGGFPGATAQDFADIEAYLSDTGGTARPDGVPDECQIAPDCDGDGITDACELGAGTQVDLNHDGIPDDCPCLGDVTGDDSTTLSDFTALASSFGLASGAVRSQGDLDNDKDVDLADFTILASDFGCTP